MINFVQIPPEYVLHPIAKPTNAEFIFEGIDKILEELPILFAYYQQRNLKYSITGKAQAGSINRMSKYSQSHEFYPDNDKDLGSIRHQ